MDDENLIWSVYIHISPSNKYYVGITSKSPQIRWGCNGNGYYRNKHFINAIKKYGWNNFDHEIIAEHLTEQEAKNFEIVLIHKLNSNDNNFGYNVTGGGNGRLGVRLFGDKNGMYGKKHSNDTRIKISKSRKGKLCGEDNSFYGKHLSEEQKKKMLEGRKKSSPKKYLPDEIPPWSKPVSNHNKDTLELINTYPSTKIAGETLNIDKTSITKCLKGDRKIAGGFVWMYIEEQS